MRDVFHDRRDALVLDLAAMCDLAGRALLDATRALLDGDAGLARRVVAGDRELDRARGAARHGAQVLLATQSPVAGDLRSVLAVLRGVEDAERMGDLARHVAEAVLRRHPEPVLPEVLRDRFARLGALAAATAGITARLVREGGSALERELTRAETQVDALHESLFPVLEHRAWRHGVPAAVDAALLSGHCERFADHARAIGRRSAQDHPAGRDHPAVVPAHAPTWMPGLRSGSDSCARMISRTTGAVSPRPTSR